MQVKPKSNAGVFFLRRKNGNEDRVPAGDFCPANRRFICNWLNSYQDKKKIQDEASVNEVLVSLFIPAA